MLKYDHTLYRDLDESKFWFRYQHFDIEIYELQGVPENPKQLLDELIHSKRFPYWYMGGDKDNSEGVTQHGPYILDQISVSSYDVITAAQALERFYSEAQENFDGYWRSDEKDAFLKEGNTPPFMIDDEHWIQNELKPMLESATTIFRLKRDTPFLEYLEGYAGAFTEWVVINDHQLILIVLHLD